MELPSGLVVQLVDPVRSKVESHPNAVFNWSGARLNFLSCDRPPEPGHTINNDWIVLNASIGSAPVIGGSRPVPGHP